MPNEHLPQPIQHTQTRLTDVWSLIHPRVVAAGLVVAAWGLLATGLAMEAEPVGLGTHQQLGLPPCGFLVETGLPCATCGMTTAFTYAVHGQLMRAFLTQPAGLAAALLAAIVVVTGVYAFWTATSLAPLARWLWRPSTVWCIAVLVIGSWFYKSLAVLGGLEP